MRYVCLRDAYLRKAFLRDGSLRLASLRYACLHYACLRDACLRFAYLRFASLRYASLRDAFLRDAYLRDASFFLRYAYLRYACQPRSQGPLSSYHYKICWRFLIKKVSNRVKKANVDGSISDKTLEYLLVNSTARAGRFYLLPKLRKRGCPGRPVISGCNTPTERISEFVDHYLKPLVASIPSYVKDTNDFLHKLNDIGTLPQNALLVTIDVGGLYPHIPHNEGLDPHCVTEELINVPVIGVTFVIILLRGTDSLVMLLVQVTPLITSWTVILEMLCI